MKWVAKFLFPCLLFLFMWSFMTMEKVTLIWTLRVLRHADISFEAGYVAVGLLILVPYIFALFEMLWNISFLTVAKEPQLPPLKNLFLGIIACIVESACVVVFTTVVATVLPVFIVLPVMSGVFSVSIILNDIKKTTYDSDDNKGSRIFRRRAVGGAYTVIAPGLAAIVLWYYGVLNWLQAVSMGVSTLGLAVVWTSAVQTQIQTTSRGFTPHPKRVQFFYGFLRAIFVVVFLALEVFLRTADSVNMEQALAQFRDNFSGVMAPKLLLPLCLNILCGLFAHGFIYLSVAFCQPLPGIVLPSLMSTVAAILFSVGVFSPYVYYIEEVQDFGDITPLLISSGILAISWAVPYIIRTSEFVRKPASLFIPFETMFLSYGWSSVFFDQHLLLSYRHDGFDRAIVRDTNSNKTSRIYVCTTMYREADYEIERLLYSLRGLSLSDKFTKCILEAHIFMDNGVKGRDLQPFGQQLIGLLSEKIGMDITHAESYETPYGIQLRWIFPGGMPVFIHFKDAGKVKPKKRWSQSMYINYVMRYRKVMSESNCRKMKLTRSPTSETIASKDSSYESERIESNSFVLKDLGKRIDSLYPGLGKLGKMDTMDSDDQGFASVDESSPSMSHSSSQARLDIDTDSIDLESKDEQSKGVINMTFTDDNGQPYPMKGDNPMPTSDNVASQVQHAVPDGERDPWSKDGSNQISITLDTEFDDDHTYILATDADMQFKDEAVLELLHLCNSDNRLGGACGRTHPTGKRVSSIVWHQKFEYAKDFWMIKNAQNVIGSVMCAPGCFSLYRASAIKDVMKKYSTPTKTPFTVYVKDTGEDRWMATLMMINGWRLRFSAFADNTTYCPDTFEEFFKQRRRWILSDIANALLVVQNLVRLVLNNDCFTFCYVSYLVNMFVNNVITPGTAIVMITAGLELVFDVPYIYTTIPFTAVVYAYAIFCTKTSTHAQTIATSVLTFVMGMIFFAVAVWGSYKIVATMVHEIFVGHFRFQQHYVILMLTLSLVYAALAHPRECYQIVYGFAYLFIFPAMHVLLPIYSIANIVDQSWGTRDSTKAKIPKLSCLVPLKKFRRKKKNKGNKDEDANDLIKDAIAAQTKNLTEGSAEDNCENEFWTDLRGTLLGNDVNLGLGKEELAERLRVLRNRSLGAVLTINFLWLALLSFFYMGVSSPLSRLNVYGVISGALYGFTLTIQVIGLTVCRVNYLLKKLARCLYGHERPMWVCEKK